MALTKCKDCGQQISPRAKSCPSCGAPIKRGFGCGTLLVVSVITVIIVAIAQNSDSGSSKPKNPVKAQAAVTRSAVSITNTDNFTWPSVTVYVNGTPLDGYKAIYDRPVAPQEEIRIPFTEFARDDKRFNPIERKVTQVKVWVAGHDAPMFSFR